MSETLIIKIVFGSLLSVGGFVLILLSFLLFYKYLFLERKCTATTKGIIKKYTLASRGGKHSGIHLPVVYYKVDNKEYKVIGPEYKAYIIISKKTPFSRNETTYNINDQVLRINRTSNSLAGIYVNPIKKEFPLNSEINVYYNPDKPKQSYAFRYCNKKGGFWLMFLSGITVFLLDLLIIILL